MAKTKKVVKVRQPAQGEINRLGDAVLMLADMIENGEWRDARERTRIILKRN